MANEATVKVSNVGGIEETEIIFTPGLNVLSGENATNRTSLLLALNEAMGGTMGTVRSGQNEGSVTLEYDGKEYTQNLSGKGANNLVRSGDPISDDSDIVDLYASLLGQNGIRRLISRGQNVEEFQQKFKELLMKPVDIEEINRKKTELKRRKQEINERIDEIETQRKELPKLEEDRQRLQDEIEDLEEEIEEIETEIGNLDFDKEDEEEAQQLMEDLRNKQDKRNNIQDRKKQQEDSVEQLENEIEELQDDIDDLESEIDSASGVNEDRINELQQKKQKLNSAREFVFEVQDIVKRLGTNNIPEEFEQQESVTDELDPESINVHCPVCGTEHSKAEIQEHREWLDEVHDDYDEQIEEIKDEKNELENKKSHTEQRQHRYQNKQNKLGRKKEDLEDAQKDVEKFEEQLEELEEEIKALDQQVEETEELREQNALDLSRESSDKRQQKARKEDRLEEVEEKIGNIEDLEGEKEELEIELDEVSEELDEKRGEINNLEEQVVEAINSNMDNLVEVLDYENIGRVWIEKKNVAGEDISNFEINVVRDGRDDEIGTLSESEQSLVGLVIGLGCYITYDVPSKLPFLLVDSIEQFDSGRIDLMLEYVSDEVGAEYVVTALLPEDAAAIESEHHEVKSTALAS